MSNWRAVTIADIGEVFDGPHATPKTVDEGPIFLGIGALKSGRLDLGETRHVTEGDYKKWTRRVEPRPGDVVFSYETRLGEAAIIPDGLRCCLGRRMGLVRVDPSKIHPRFFLYNYIAPHYQEFLRGHTVHGATVDRILLKEFPSFPFPCPPLDEQEKVVSLLGALDDKIELNRQTNETLEALARAIFKDWFVDFGPTRAKAEGRAPYLAQALWDLFPDRLDGEGKPEGWRRFRLDEIAEQSTGAISPSSEAHRLFEHYSIPAFDAGREPAMDEGNTIKSNKTSVPANAVLLSKLNPAIARTWLPNAAGELPQVCSTEFLVFTAKPSASRELLYCLFSDDDFRRSLVSMATGTSNSHQRVKPKVLLAGEVLAGSVETFAAFTDAVAPSLEKTLASRSESRTLAQTRDLLLPKLMSGEIRLREAERLVEDAA
jgi:type I restriction enzyme, S subunit